MFATPRTLPSSAATCEPADLNTLIGWHARYAVNPSSLAALTSMTWTLRLPGQDGGLGLTRIGGVLVASGEPLAPPSAWPALAGALIDLAGLVGARPCVVPVGAEYAATLQGVGLRTVRLGSTPYVHLQDWPARGNAGAGVRAAVNRARRDALVMREVGQERGAPGWQAEVQALATDWLRRRRAHITFRWIFELRPLVFSDHKRYFEARCSNRLVGLIAASPLPGRSGWYLEDVLRAEAAPASTNTALVAFALGALRASGARLATLGGVPLARQRGWDDAAVSAPERLAYHLRPALSLLYDFGGLETFKRRFGPAHWENEFVALPQDLGGLIVGGVAVTRLILRGR